MLSYEEYRILVEQAPILVWRSDETGGCDYFNQRWLEFTGKPIDIELGDGWTKGVHPDDYGRCLSTYVEAFNRRVPFEMEYRLLRFDGCYRWLFDRGSPFFRQSGEFGGYIGSCVDVTDRVEAQEALTKKRLAEMAQLQALLPICSYCRKVRNDEGYWQAVEEYICANTMTEFSHGVCPTCVGSLRKSVGRTQMKIPI